jgi:hypothetical protein
LDLATELKFNSEMGHQIYRSVLIALNFGTTYSAEASPSFAPCVYPSLKVSP